MRRLAGLVVVMCVLALAGCARLPNGVDGDLVNDWGSMPAPKSTFPSVGTCFVENSSNLLTNPPMSCRARHTWETVALGTFSGSAAKAAAAPVTGSAAMLAAYHYCQLPARKYLGGDWHDGLLEFTVLPPDDGAWAGGARWFACLVAAAATVDYGGMTDRSSSLRSVLTKAGPIKLACANWIFDRTAVDDIVSGSCAKRHSGEYAGTGTIAGSSLPEGSRWRKAASAACEAVVAHYLGFTGDHVDNSSVGWVWLRKTESDWYAGDHMVRCYASAWTHDHKFVGTVKGIRTAKARG